MVKTVAILFLITLLPIFGRTAPLKEGTAVRISWLKNIVEFSSDDILYKLVGGAVFVSNAPETINEEGTVLSDGSVVTSQYNNTLYRDYMEGTFRFWASHYNQTNQQLKFWFVAKNVTSEKIEIFRTLAAYAQGAITSAASLATVEFMQSSCKNEFLGSLMPGETLYFQYSDLVPEGLAMVYIGEFMAKNLAGEDAKIEVSNVVTTDDILDPTEFIKANQIARTNATKTQSDDYRGTLKHWGREGIISLRLSNFFTSWGVSIGDRGYIGEQENLISRWNIYGEPIEPSQVRFTIATIAKIRQAYWFIDYEIDITIVNKSSFEDFQCFYGSAGYNPGFVNYQINSNPVINKHFAKEEAVLISLEKNFRLRTMVMPSASLPLVLYFVTGQKN